MADADALRSESLFCNGCSSYFTFLVMKVVVARTMFRTRGYVLPITRNILARRRGSRRDDATIGMCCFALRLRAILQCKICFLLAVVACAGVRVLLNLRTLFLIRLCELRRQVLSGTFKRRRFSVH